MTPDERLRAEFEEWLYALDCCVGEDSDVDFLFTVYRAAAEKRDGEIELQDQDIHRLQELCGNLKLENDQLKELYYPRRPPEEDEG